MRAKCINNHNQDGVRDPELTHGKFYVVKNKNIQVTGSDVSFISVIGDKGNEIERPATYFQVFKK